MASASQRCRVLIPQFLPDKTQFHRASFSAIDRAMALDILPG